jgi:predicted MFS family arabinose efflux permease
MVVVGLVKIIYDPTAQAYLGDRVPYNRRGLVWGILELNWAGSLIVIAPIAGFLLATAGLRSVLVFFAIMGLFALIVVWRHLPADRHEETSAALSGNPLHGLRMLRNNPVGMGALGSSLCLVIANEMFFINYGVWMDSSFDLVLTGLGLVTISIAIAEVIGELLVVAVADRAGKRNMALVGAVGSSLTYLVLPYLAFSLYAAMLGLFVLFVFFEVAVVASIPLFTEIMPDARAVMMSGNISAHALGRLAGSAVGGLLYAWLGDFSLVCVIAMACGLGACVVMWCRIPEISSVNP